MRTGPLRVIPSASPSGGFEKLSGPNQGVQCGWGRDQLRGIKQRAVIPEEALAGLGWEHVWSPEQEDHSS